MPTLPAALPRLDCPPKGGAWRLKRKLLGPEGRRDEFVRLGHLPARHIDLDERLARMRTLLDLGLWGDIDSAQSPQGMERVLGWFEPVDLRKLQLGYADRQSRQVDHAFKPVIDRGMDPRVLHLLIEAGMDLEVRDEQNHADTPLLRAVRLGLVEHAKVLLRAGAQVDVLDSCSSTPLKLAVERHARAQGYRENAEELVVLLLGNGADPNHIEVREHDRPVPPLWIAASTFDVDLVRTLTENGALPAASASVPVGLVEYVRANAQTSQWSHWMGERFGEVCQMLIPLGLDIEVPSALLGMMSDRNEVGVDVLLGVGARLDAVDAMGMTVAHHLVYGHEPEDPFARKMIPLIPQQCWAARDQQGRLPQELLLDKSVEWEMAGGEYDPRPWNAFFQARALAQDTLPAPSGRRRSRF